MQELTLNQPKEKSSFKRVQLWCLLFLAAFALLSEPSVYAAKILYVQRRYSVNTVAMINILRAQGQNVTVLNTDADAVDTAANYAAQGYDLLIADEAIDSSQVGTNFYNSPIPVISWEAFLNQGGRNAFTDPAASAGTYADATDAQTQNAYSGNISPETNIVILDPSNPLAAGLSGTVLLYDPNATTDNRVGFCATRNLVSGATPVASVPGWSGGYTIFGVDVGVTNWDGVTTNRARWVHLPWYNNNGNPGPVLVEPSFFLFEAAVAWAMHLPQPTKIYSLQPQSSGFLPTNTVVSFAVDKMTAGNSAVDTNGIHLTINGTDVIGNAFIDDAGTQWMVTYTNGFAPNQTYTIVASATAADGGFSARQISIDTFDQSNFMLEAENFNFDGGMFFDNPVLCDTPGGTVDGCYFDRVGSNNVDQLELDNTVTVATPTSNEVYRFGPGLTREENVDTYLTDDPVLRQKYMDAGIPDYEVRNITDGEWLNYTRAYPTGTFQIYARISAPGPANIELDAVDGATTTNQNLTKLGNFISNNGTGGYALVPLTDNQGTPVVVELTNSSPMTLRMTAVTGGYVANFYMFVPTTAAVNQPPTTQITGPTNYSVVSAGSPVQLTADATDADGTITNVEFYVVGGGTTNVIGNPSGPSYGVTWTPVAYGPLSYQTIHVIATDNGGLSAQDAISVKVTDPAYRIVSTADGSGADAEMQEQNDLGVTSESGGRLNTRTSSNGDRNEIIALRFDLSGYTLADLQGVKLNVIEYRANGARQVAVYGVAQGTSGGTGVYTTENWDEDALTAFGDMPGLEVTDGDYLTQSLNTNSLTTLVADQTYTGGKEDIDAFDTPELQTFVNGYSGSSLVTFLIAAAPGYTSTGQGRIASKEATALDSGTPTGPAGWFAPYLSFSTQPVQPQLNYSMTPGGIQFNWSGSFKLQVQTNDVSTGLGTNWVDYPSGGSSGVTVPVDASQGSVFFRLISNQ